MAQFQLHVLEAHAAVARERDSWCAANHSSWKAKPRAQIGQDLAQVGPDVVRQHETILQLRAPAHQRRV